MTQQTASPNIVSDPPLMAPFIDANGRVSRVWAIWFRDMYKRVADKRGNAIDENLDTTEEVIQQVLLNIQNIETNRLDIQNNESDILTNTQNITINAGKISDNEQDISGNAQDISDNSQSISDNTQAIEDNTEYINLTRSQAKDAFVAAGYGGIGVDALKTIGTINSTFQTIEGFDVDLINTPKFVTYDKVNHGIKLDKQGVWEITVKVALTFDEVNAGRQIQLRSYNATTSTAGAITFNYFIGRNQAGVNIPLTISIEVPQGNEGDLIQLQIGSAVDTFSNSVNIGTIYQVKHISELKDDLV